MEGRGCEDIAFLGFGACIPKLINLEILQSGHKNGGSGGSRAVNQHGECCMASVVIDVTLSGSLAKWLTAEEARNQFDKYYTIRSMGFHSFVLVVISMRKKPFHHRPLSVDVLFHEQTFLKNTPVQSYLILHSPYSLN